MFDFFLQIKYTLTAVSLKDFVILDILFAYFAHVLLTFKELYLM